MGPVKPSKLPRNENGTDAMKKMFVLLLLLLGEPARGQNPDSFLAAVRKREAAVKVVDMTFSLKEILLKNNPTPMAEVLKTLGKAETILAEDVVLQSTNRIVIQGTMTRYEGAQPVWQLELGKPLPYRALAVTNSRGPKSFYPDGKGKDTEPSGAIPTTQGNHYLQGYYMRPVGVSFRGLDRTMTPYPVQSFKPSMVRQRIGERECIEYVKHLSNDSRQSYFVDPGMDNNVVRMISFNRGNVNMQIDITYAKNPVCDWVPDFWVAHTYTGAGKLERRTEVRVISSKFNESLPEDQFDIVYPPGTRVWKASEQKHYRVQPDSGFQLLTWSRDAVPSLVPVQDEVPWYRRYLWWIVGCIGVVALVAVVVRRRQGFWLRR